nr:gliding motility-associated C-terminal domain-containing protein [Bacteroidota bacterium]
MQHIDGLSAGTYDLEIMDANGCVLEESVTLNMPVPITAELSMTENDCAGGTHGAISTQIAGGSGTFDLLWAGPDGFTSTAADITDLMAGNYTLIITDQLGCSSSINTSLQDPMPLQSGAYVSFYGVYNLQCVGDSSGVIELYPTGGTGPYTISVSAPDGSMSNEAVMDHLSAGEYSISITDLLGCTLDTTITLTEPSVAIDATFNMSVYPSGTNVSCYDAADGWIEAEVTGGMLPYEIFWRGPDSLEWSMADIYNLPAGDYSYELVVIDANQCSFTTAITLTQPDTSIFANAITSQYGNYNIACAEDTNAWIDITADGGNGGLTYEWNGPGGSIATTEDLQNIGAGTFTVSITDINGCVLDQAIDIVSPDPVAIAFSWAAINCPGEHTGIIQADISGGNGEYSHSWIGPGVLPDAPLEISDLLAGTYCLSVTDGNGCIAQDCISLEEPEPVVINSIITEANCGSSNGAVDLTINGGMAPYGYLWSNGSTDQDLSGLSSGSFDISITDANGCITSGTIVIEGTPGITTSAEITSVPCAGDNSGAIDLSINSGQAPFVITWSNGASTEDLIGIPAGDHSVSITDANGCSMQAVYTIDQSTGLLLDTILSLYSNGYNVSNYQGTDGSITIEPIGGTSPYQIAWSNGSTENSITGVSAGSYAVEVTDINGCAASLVIQLTQPSDLEMPTGYSPNGDGSNDFFFIRGLDGYQKNRFTVYNRWGNVVFDRLNYRNDWAGENSNGDELANGTYFVILTVDEGNRILQGYVDMRR